MRLTHRAFLAANQGIRGGPEKTLGKTLSRLFAGRDPVDLSSGDMPLCLGNGHFSQLDAVFSRFNPTIMAYDHGEYRKAQDGISRYLGRSSASDRFLRSQVVGGISSVMQPLLRNIAYALGYDEGAAGSSPPFFVLCPPIHPNWLSAIVAEFGYGVIKSIRRNARGYPDMEDAARVFRSLDRPFVAISTPDENPAGTCTPNSVYFNDSKTGILNLIVDVPTFGFWIWDAIYKDFSWGPHANKRDELQAAAVALGIRTIILHSLSKIFMKPGLRVGGMYYAGPMDKYGAEFCNLVQVEADNKIKNGISSPSLPVLQLAYSGDAKVEAEKGRVLEHAQRHVLENQLLLQEAGLPHVFPEIAVPGSPIDTAMYGFHRLDGVLSTALSPWEDPVYQEWLVKTISDRLKRMEVDPGETVRWENFVDFKGAFRLTPSRALAMELAMNGAMCLPYDPFYPRFSDTQLTRFKGIPQNGDREALVLRLILAYSENTVREFLSILERVKGGAMESYPRGPWRSRYK